MEQWLAVVDTKKQRQTISYTPTQALHTQITATMIFAYMLFILLFLHTLNSIRWSVDGEFHVVSTIILDGRGRRMMVWI